MRILTLASIVLPLLACGGASFAPLDVPALPVAPTVQAHTQALCDHLAATNEAPCTAVSSDRSAPFAGLEVRVVGVEPIRARNAGSYEERQALNASGGTALAVVVEITNATPVKAGHDFGVSLYTADGELRMQASGPSGQYAKEKGVAHSWSFGNLGPRRAKRVAYVYPVPESELADATLSFQKVEYKPDPRDPRGRRRNFVVDQVLIELPTPARM